ncbi:MAG: hypothetical protein H6737_10240 [Alphaproteobacteria bacterium]|nr:hypothetical protein [Alphaproteobacteria bacterium]
MLPTGISVAPGWWEDIEQRYATPVRAYHSAAHVAEVLEHWAWVDAHVGWASRETTWVAVLLHDAVYEAGHGDNEIRSADLVAPWCARFRCGANVKRAAALVRLTADHGKLARGDVDTEAALFLDCDMAILGAAPERFDTYCDQVRDEYAPIASPRIFDAGRRQFLERLLSRPIFLSDAFRERFEDSARANIERALRQRC